MIMFLIVNNFFRGSPILPAGASLIKPPHVWSAEGRTTVHSKLLAKTQRQEKKCTNCQQTFILKLFVKILSMTASSRDVSLSLSPDRTNSPTMTVASKIPRAQSCPDSDPSLLVWVGSGLSRLYDCWLRGTPLMLSVSLNVNLSFPLLIRYFGVRADVALGDLNVLDHLGLRVVDDTMTWCLALLAIALLTGRSGAAAGTGTRAASTAVACAAIVILITGRRAAAVTEINVNSDTQRAAAPFPLPILVIIALHAPIINAMLVYVDSLMMTDHQTLLCLDLYQSLLVLFITSR